MDSAGLNRDLMPTEAMRDRKHAMQICVKVALLLRGFSARGRRRLDEVVR